jgi:hypothetical protein
MAASNLALRHDTRGAINRLAFMNLDDAKER